MGFFFFVLLNQVHSLWKLKIKTQTKYLQGSVLQVTIRLHSLRKFIVDPWIIRNVKIDHLKDEDNFFKSIFSANQVSSDFLISSYTFVLDYCWWLILFLQLSLILVIQIIPW